jgi:hypothetical protein
MHLIIKKKLNASKITLETGKWKKFKAQLLAKKILKDKLKNKFKKTLTRVSALNSQLDYKD